MFTLKLYSQVHTRIVAAESFTVYRYNDCSFQITAHQPSGRDDEAFYVGDDSGPRCSIDAHWYDRAIIENAAGKTTEFIQPPPKAMASIAESRAA